MELGKLKYGKSELTEKYCVKITELERFSLYLKFIAAAGAEHIIDKLLAVDGEGGFLNMVHNTLLKISEDEKMRDLADSRAAFLFDQYFREKNARDEGYNSGYSEGHGAGYSEGHGAGYSEGHGIGYGIGQNEALNMVAARMIQSGMEGSVVLSVTGLDRKKIDEIAEGIGVKIVWDKAV